MLSVDVDQKPLLLPGDSQQSIVTEILTSCIAVEKTCSFCKIKISMLTSNLMAFTYKCMYIEPNRRMAIKVDYDQRVLTKDGGNPNHLFRVYGTPGMALPS